MEDHLKMRLLVVLRSLRCNISPSWGLCIQLQWELKQAHFALQEEIKRLMALWPLSSGYAEFPVPHPEMNPYNAFMTTDETMWDKRTEYGSNRWNLLEFMIQQLEEELCE